MDPWIGKDLPVTMMVLLLVIIVGGVRPDLDSQTAQLNS